MGGREERPQQSAAHLGRHSSSPGPSPPAPRPAPAAAAAAAAAMDSRALALALALAALLLLGALSAADGKPISLTYRCPCRYVESNVAKSHIKHLKILTVPGCSLQIIARLKNSSKQICIDSKLKWIQEYVEKYLHKF
ncbi:stromal cell-derived factor 1 isoform X2 [Pogona vitticeps]